MSDATRTGKTPWHLWVVGAASLLWNGFGGYDYVMTNTRNQDYMAMLTPEQLAYFEGFPDWMTAVWAIGVWGAAAGSVLLLLRSRFAFHVFALSFAAMAVGVVYQFGLTEGLEVMGPTAIVMSAVIAVVAAALVFYARAMAKRGVLR